MKNICGGKDQGETPDGTAADKYSIGGLADLNISRRQGGGFGTKQQQIRNNGLTVYLAQNQL